MQYIFLETCCQNCCCRLAVMAEALEEIFSHDKFEESVIKNAAQQYCSAMGYCNFYPHPPVEEPGNSMEGGVIFQPRISMEGSKLSLEFPSRGGHFSAWSFHGGVKAQPGIGGVSFLLLANSIFISKFSVFIGKNRKIEKILSL